MKNNLGMLFGLPRWCVGAALVGLCAFTPVSRASLYSITFSGLSGGNSVNGTGQIDVSGGVADFGSITISGTDGTANGVWTLQAGSGTSPGGGFVYDSAVNPAAPPANPFLDNSGLLFTSGGNELNFFSYSTGDNYRLNGYIATAYTPVAFGTATIAAVPEPINCALAAFGLIFVGGSASRFYLGRRRSFKAS